MSDEIANLLRGTELLQGIAPEDLKRVAAISRVEEFPAQHDIFKEHETAKDVYVIISGRVSLVICAPPVGCRQLMEVGEGEMIGWSPLVGRSLLSDTARTLAPTKAIAMDARRLLDLCREDPRFGFEFMHRTAQALAARLHASRTQLMKMSGMMLPQVQLESD
jgi:CRP/FNR family transcriptional regulator, cyclic AMP receptor protein